MSVERDREMVWESKYEIYTKNIGHERKNC